MTLPDRVQELRLAMMLLTRIPAGTLHTPAPDFARAAWAYPVAGAVVGALCGTLYCAAAALGTPALTTALLALGAGVLLTGALHEDGLADVADGFGGGATAQRKLEIMRDSRVGTYGVVAVVLVIGLLATSIAAHEAGWRVFFLFVAIGALSRAMMLIPMTLLPAARNDGLGASAVLEGPQTLVIALFIALLLALPVLFFALIAGGAMAAVAFGFARLARRQIGGQSGDVLGATQKLGEVAGWVTLAIIA